MSNFPKLETQRLCINKLQSSDITAIVKYANNKNITDNTRSIPYPYSEQDALTFLHKANEGFKQKNTYWFAMRKKAKNQFMGSIGLLIDIPNNRAELGYWLGEPFWNKGYTTEAVGALFKFGFEHLNLNKIIAVYLSTNKASGKVMLKNGMIKEGEFKDHDIKKDHSVADGKYVSLIQYRMLKSEYKQLKVEDNAS